MKLILPLIRAHAHTLILCALSMATYWHRRMQADRMEGDIEALKAQASRIEVALDRLARVRPGKK